MRKLNSLDRPHRTPAKVPTESRPEAGRCPDRRTAREMARVLVHALIRVDADGAGIRQPEGASRLHPVVDETLHQSFAELELQHFVEPTLRDVEDQQATGDQEENAELIEKLAHIAPRQRIEEGFVPAVQPDLSVSRRGDDEHRDHDQAHQRFAGRRGEDRAGERADLGHEPGRGCIGFGFGAGDFGRAIGHGAGHLATRRWARIPVIRGRCREPRREPTASSRNRRRRAPARR